MRHLSHPVSFQRRLRWGLVLNLINPVFWMLPVSIHFRCLKNTLASEYWLFSVRVVCHFVFCCILLRFYFCCCVWFCFSSIGSIRWLSAYQGLITPLFLMHVALNIFDSRQIKNICIGKTFRKWIGCMKLLWSVLANQTPYKPLYFDLCWALLWSLIPLFEDLASLSVVNWIL